MLAHHQPKGYWTDSMLQSVSHLFYTSILVKMPVPTVTNNISQCYDLKINGKNLITEAQAVMVLLVLQILDST